MSIAPRSGVAAPCRNPSRPTKGDRPQVLGVRTGRPEWPQMSSPAWDFEVSRPLMGCNGRFSQTSEAET
jgi:hypothetical protein